MPALPLSLHGRYGRKDAFATVGIEYSSRKQNLDTGLFPQCPDGGYFIFITVNKEDLDLAYDYDDELFSDRFRWVTRRDRAEDHPDYVNVRDPKTRISLFVRGEAKDPFVYLGELKYKQHRQFLSEGRVQQEYVFDLAERVPDGLLGELTVGEYPKRVSQRAARRRRTTLRNRVRYAGDARRPLTIIRRPIPTYWEKWIAPSHRIITTTSVD
jgi:hypothetical protein